MNIKQKIIVFLVFFLIVVSIVYFTLLKNKEEFTTTDGGYQDCKGTWIWDSCDDTGKKTGKFKVEQPATNGGAPCPTNTLSQNCPINYTGTWNNWSAPDVNGNITRTFNTTRDNLNGGLAPPTTETVAIKSDCYGTWETNGICDGNSGLQRFTFKTITGPKNGGLACPINDRIVPCNVDCVLGSWGSFASLDSGKTAIRNRPIVQQPKNSGLPCTATSETVNIFRETTGTYDSFGVCDPATAIQTAGWNINNFNLGQSGYDLNYLTSLGNNLVDTSRLIQPKAINSINFPPLKKSCSVDCTGFYDANWSVCDPNTGDSFKNFNIITQKAGSGKDCPPLQIVNPVKCDIDCIGSYESNWSVCNPTTGKQQKNFIPTITKKGNGKECPGPIYQECMDLNIIMRFRNKSGYYPTIKKINNNWTVQIANDNNVDSDANFFITSTSPNSKFPTSYFIQHANSGYAIFINQNGSLGFYPIWSDANMLINISFNSSKSSYNFSKAAIPNPNLTNISGGDWNQWIASTTQLYFGINNSGTTFENSSDPNINNNLFDFIKFEINSMKQVLSNWTIGSTVNDFKINNYWPVINNNVLIRDLYDVCYTYKNYWIYYKRVSMGINGNQVSLSPTKPPPTTCFINLNCTSLPDPSTYNLSNLSDPNISSFIQRVKDTYVASMKIIYPSTDSFRITNLKSITKIEEKDKEKDKDKDNYSNYKIDYDWTNDNPKAEPSYKNGSETERKVIIRADDNCNFNVYNF